MPDEPSLIDEVESGDRVRGLLALRVLLATRLKEGVADRDLAALTRRLMQVMDELEALGAVDNDAPTAEDEFAQRREAVLSAAGVERTPARRNTRAKSSRARR